MSFGDCKDGPGVGPKRGAVSTEPCTLCRPRKLRTPRSMTHPIAVPVRDPGFRACVFASPCGERRPGLVCDCAAMVALRAPSGIARMGSRADGVWRKHARISELPRIERPRETGFGADQTESRPSSATTAQPLSKLSQIWPKSDRSRSKSLPNLDEVDRTRPT